jgi:hypothetical protein
MGLELNWKVQTRKMTYKNGKEQSGNLEKLNF